MLWLLRPLERGRTKRARCICPSRADPPLLPLLDTLGHTLKPALPYALVNDNTVLGWVRLPRDRGKPTRAPHC